MHHQALRVNGKEANLSIRLPNLYGRSWRQILLHIREPVQVIQHADNLSAHLLGIAAFPQLLRALRAHSNLSRVTGKPEAYTTPPSNRLKGWVFGEKMLKMVKQAVVMLCIRR